MGGDGEKEDENHTGRSGGQMEKDRKKDQLVRKGTESQKGTELLPIIIDAHCVC